jgi:myxalamid-type polyketide synthase MxaD
VLELRGVGIVDQAPGQAAHDVEDWLYQVEWRRVGRVAAGGALDGTCVVFGSGPVAEAFAAGVRACGGGCVVVPPGDREHVSEALAAETPPPSAVLFAGGLDAPPADRLSPGSLEELQQGICAGALAVVQGMCDLSAARPPALWLATRDAVATGAGERVEGLAASTLWGLARTIANEHPEMWGGIVDLDAEAPPEEAARCLLEQMQSGDAEDQVAFRAGERHAPRLERSPRAQAHQEIALREDATYLIAGGLGPVGLALAGWLAERGARSLALIGRSGLPAGDPRAGAVEAIENRGVQIRTAAVDVADETQLRELAAELADDGCPPVRGVFHAAAVVDDRLLRDVPAGALEPVLRPKVRGAWALHEAFPDVDLFVLFSSAAALFGLPGQGSYAAANSFLGALARHRRERGMAGLAVHWSAWSGLGLAESEGAVRVTRHLERSGIHPLPPSGALRALGMLLSRDETEAAVLHADGPPPSLGRLGFGPDVPEPESVREELRARMATASSPEERRLVLEEQLAGAVARILHLDASEVDPRQPIQGYGLDSMLALELRRSLEVTLGLPLSATLFWTYPSLRELAGHLAPLLDENGPGEEAATGEEETLDDDLVAVLAEVRKLEEA